MNIYQILLIAIGSALGGVSRFLLSNFIYQLFGRNFPSGTLIVNISGCFLMGLLFIIILERLNGLSEILRALLLIGFLGGFTTFSSFSIEAFNLWENGELLKTSIYILSSVMGCLIATMCGVWLGRQL